MKRRASGVGARRRVSGTALRVEARNAGESWRLVGEEPSATNAYTTARQLVSGQPNGAPLWSSVRVMRAGRVLWVWRDGQLQARASERSHFGDHDDNDSDGDDADPRQNQGEAHREGARA